jgi:hypothetical protein
MGRRSKPWCPGLTTTRIHVLLYPAGTKLAGTVTRTIAAGWMKKNGQLLFSFHSAQTPDGAKTEMIATVAGIEAPGAQWLAVGQEGHVKATTSTFSRLRAPLSLIGPSRAVADTSVDKTAWSRAGEGRGGFGLLGAGAAQASATTECACCRAASPTINGRRRSQGRAPASLRYSEIKSPTKHICSTGRIALHLGSRMVSVIDSATLAPRPLPAMWSVRKCWPA